MRQLVAVRPRPPHTRSACHTAIPSHMCFSPRAPARLTYAVPTRPDPQLLLATRPRPSKTRVIAGLVHRHAQQRDGSIAHTGTSGTTPHGKNESIARAGIESKLVLSGMIIQHTPPPDMAVELCMPCQALSK